MTVTNAHLAEGATEVAEGEFQERRDVKAVELHEVTKVGKLAFGGCENLERVALPLTAEIHPDAFQGCDPARLTIRFVGVLADADPTLARLIGRPTTPIVEGLRAAVEPARVPA